MQHLQPNTTLQGGKYKIERVLGVDNNKCFFSKKSLTPSLGDDCQVVRCEGLCA